MRPHALAPLLIVCVAACSGGSTFAQPKASSFAPGACRNLSAPVLTLGKQLHALGTLVPTRQQSDRIKVAQTGVRSLQARTPSALAPTVQELVTAVGILRIRTDTNSYDPALAATAMTAYQHVVTACTTP